MRIFLRIIDPYRLIDFLQVNFSTSRRQPQNILRAVPLAESGINRLPDELLEVVLISIGTKRQQCLSRLSRTCRRLYKLTQALLFANVVICCSNYDLLLRTLREDPGRKRQIQRVIIELDGLEREYDRASSAARRLESCFARILGGCTELKTIELRKGDRLDSWRAKIHSLFLKYCLKKAKDLPSLTTLNGASGQFSLHYFPTLPNIKNVFFSLSPFDYLLDSLSCFPNLEIMRVAIFYFNKIHNLVDIIEDRKEENNTYLSLNVQESNITNVIARWAPLPSPPADGRLFLTIDLGPTNMLAPETVADSISGTMTTILFIVEETQVQEMQLRYTIPPHWQRSVADLMADVKDKIFEAAGFSAFEAVQYSSFIDGILREKYREAVSKILQPIHTSMGTFATQITEASGVMVELEFVETSFEKEW